ncbi:NAD(P)/FAD-dependent oxidoreductase [Rhodanobacter spathiphylli]|uniref:Fumarate reductase/succinate dehydrogenase flavoprotein domain-containing protein n=1 Tax=Rhodanobacter spathiphylli B39 TaxID=1163407 RepID=I4W2M6_9GAMM|nr:tryptophan 7-halogenase [Rhodanobacter spathiphylli]EIL93717.1 fumarate reductase/succinate dehydrogenase flavoprotein domain-containing protein [Rhodanobacter spathiphylli B39]
MSRTEHEAVILGGGLAGLCLALQLRGEFPDMDILVLERNRHPLPVAAHKVGESTVEIGAHYFDHTLGLREHLDAAHIRKFGLRYFFSEGRDDIQNTTELGVSRVLPVPSYQLDRGIFENFLGEEARRRGIDFRDGATVRGFSLGEHGDAHEVRFTDDKGEHTVAARWLLDASGRAGLLRRRLELTADNGHHANAVWFRMDARLHIDRWSDDAEWGARCTPAERWRSTNHLMGAGYWAWLIPLGSGAHSVGIVCDAAMHPLDGMRDFEHALRWLQEKQPAMGRAIAAERDSLLDFRFLRDYSFSSRRLFSADRWALTGEAGSFLDPFYSPGSDFIAISNTYITGLIGHDRAGHNLAPYAHFYEKLYLSFYDSTLTLFRNQYPLFGNAEVLSAKVIWDYAYYWSVLCQLVFQQRLTDLAFLGEMRAELERAQALNSRMQSLFRHWHAAGGGHSRREMLDQCALAWFGELNATLHDPLDEAGVRARLRHNVRMLDGVADALVLQASASDPRLHVPMSGQPRPPLFRAVA